MSVSAANMWWIHLIKPRKSIANVSQPTPILDKRAFSLKILNKVINISKLSTMKIRMLAGWEIINNSHTYDKCIVDSDKTNSTKFRKTFAEWGKTESIYLLQILT